MSEVDDFLEHYGVKGMKWGVRRAQKKMAKADAKFQKKAYSRASAVKMYNAAAGNANKDLPGINKKWAGKDLKGSDKLQAAYNKEVLGNFNKHLQKEANTFGLNPSGTKKVEAKFDANGNLNVNLVDIKHDGIEDFNIRLVRDSNGLVIRYEIQTPLAQTDLTVEEFIEHYGIKGMKWGVRRSKAEIAKASADAKKAEKIRATAKTSGTNALTNKQLQTAINRMNLEVNYARLNEQTRKKSLGEKAVKFLMKDVAEVEVKRVVKGKAAITVEKTLSKHGQQDVADRIKPKKKK